MLNVRTSNEPFLTYPLYVRKRGAFMACAHFYDHLTSNDVMNNIFCKEDALQRSEAESKVLHIIN